MKTTESRRFVNILFLFVYFYSFLYKSFEIYVKDEGNHMAILNFFKFKNIFGFLSFVFDSYVRVDAESLFQRLIISFIFVFLLPCSRRNRTFVPYRLLRKGAGKGDTNRSVFYAFRRVPIEDIYGGETPEGIETDVNASSTRIMCSRQ